MSTDSNPTTNDMKKIINIIPVVFALAIIIITVISWIANVYDWRMNNLITQDGFRWFVANFMNNIKNAPWEYVILISCTVSIVAESEILNLKKKKIYLKQKRAYMVVAMLAMVFMAIAITLYLLPGNMLMTAFGTFRNSPLQHGIIPIILMSVIALAVTFGYASGRFVNFEDMMKAMVKLIVNIAEYFITFIIAAQLFAVIDYVATEAYEWNDSDSICRIFAHVSLFWIPWIIHVINAYR